MTTFQTFSELIFRDKYTAPLDKAATTGEKRIDTMTAHANKSASIMAKNYKAGMSKMKSGATQVFKGVMIAAPLIGFAKQKASFSAGMAEIATMTDMTAKQAEAKFTGIIESAQIAFGESSKEVQKAVYDGLSSGVPATKKAVSAYIQEVGKLSTVGNVSMAVSADALTTIVNSYGVSYAEASNMIFKTARAGKTTVGELSASYGQLASTAKGSGISLADMSATVASLTAVGMKTAEAMTATKAVLSGLMKPTSDAAKGFSDLGVSITKTALKQKGLTGIMAEIKQKLNIKYNGDEDKINSAMTRLFPNVRAMGASFAMTGERSANFSATLAAMKDKTDIVGKKFADMASTDAQQFKSAMQSAQVATKGLGAIALPIFTKLANKMRVMMTATQNAQKKYPGLFKAVVYTTLGIAALTVTLGLAKMAFGAMQIVYGVAKGLWAFFFATTTADGATKASLASLIFKKIALFAGAVATGVASAALWIYNLATGVATATTAAFGGSLLVTAGVFVILAAGVASWVYVLTQASDKTTALGSDIAVLTSGLDGLAAVWDKLGGFASYLFHGGEVTKEAAAASNRVDDLARKKKIGRFDPEVIAEQKAQRNAANTAATTPGKQALATAGAGAQNNTMMNNFDIKVDGNATPESIDKLKNMLEQTMQKMNKGQNTTRRRI